MGFCDEFVHVYTIRCDGCRKETRPAFHRIVTVATAKRQRYERFETVSGDKKEVHWFCSGCLRKPGVREGLEQKNVTALPVRKVASTS